MLSNYFKNALKHFYYKRVYPASKISLRSFIDEKSSLSSAVQIAPGCLIEKSYIGSGTKIQRNCYVANSNLGENVALHESSHIENSKIDGKTFLMREVFLRDVSLSAFSYLAQGVLILNTEIGKFCSIGSNLICAPGDHPTNLLSTSPLFYLNSKPFDFSFSTKDEFNHNQKAFIGHDVWIGARVFIKNGLKIGNGAIIAAGAVVVKDVPDYAIVAGVPAKIIRFRFPQETIDKLLEIQWWNWSEEELSEAQKFFIQDDIAPFLKWIESNKESFVG